MEDATALDGDAPDTTTEKVEQKENNDIIECYARTLSKVKSNEIKALQCADSINEMKEDRSNNGSCLLVDHASVSSDDLMVDFEQPFKYDYPVVKSSPNNKIPMQVPFKSEKSPSRSKWQEIEPDSDEEFDPIQEIVKCSRMNSADSTTKCLADSKSPLISDYEGADASQKSTSPVTSLPNISTDNDSAVTREVPSTDTKTSDVAPTDPNPQDALIERDGEVSDKNDFDKQLAEKENDEGSSNDENDKKDAADDSKDDDDEEDDDATEETKVNKMKEIKRKLAIKKLNSLVEKLNKKIQHLEEQELTLNDMDGDSVYTQLELYKKKFVLVWKKLCELTNQTPSTGREMEKPFVFRGTNYPQINKAITRFVNRYQAFPDYQDIYEIVSTCNEFFKLKLNKQMMSNISTSAFTDVGKSLKNRRIRDYKENFGNHLTDRSGSERDPAMDDPELRKKLDENKRKADSNMEKAFHHFESLPAKENNDNDDNDDSDDSEDENDEDVESSAEKRAGVDRAMKGSDPKLDEDDHIELISSEEEKSLQKLGKEDVNSANSSSESVGELNYSSGKKSTTKKSLSTRYDAKKPDVRSKINKSKSRESSIESNDSEVSRNNSAASRAQELKNGSITGSSRRRASDDSTRSLRSNSRSLTPSVSESTRSSKRKAESGIGPKSSKKQKITVERTSKSDGPRPKFVCLMDEIKIYKTGEVMASVKTEPNESGDMLAHITKALTPSKVVLRNCMSCKVICQKAALPESLEISRNIFSKGRTPERSKGKPSGDRKKNNKVASEAHKSTSKSSTLKDLKESSPKETIKKPTSMDETCPTAESNVDSGKQPAVAPSENKCVDLSDSDDSEAGCSKNAKETEEGSVCSIFGKIVGEVLTFEECDEIDTSKEEEGIVKTVGSLKLLKENSGADGDKPEEAKVPSPPPPVPEVVDLEEPDSKNEDGIIFVGAYKTSSALTNLNPTPSTSSTAHCDPESSNAVAQSSKSQPRFSQVRTSPYSPTSKLILSQRNRKKFNAFSSTTSNSLNFGTPRRFPAFVPRSAAGADAMFPESEGDLMTRLLDPSFPTSNIGVPKLPAKIVRQINNMTKKITGVGRSKTSSMNKTFQGGASRYAARSSFSVGTTVPVVGTDAAGKTLQRKAYLEEFYQHCAPVSYNPANRKRMARTSLVRGNIRFSTPIRNNNYAFQSRVPETVVIDDDDSAGIPNRTQSDAVNASRPNDRSFKEVEPPRKKNRMATPIPVLQNSARGNVTFASSSDSCNAELLQQRKFQQKTQSSDSDVILCGVEFEGETLSIDLESGNPTGDPERPPEEIGRARSGEREFPSADQLHVGTDEAVDPTNKESEHRQLPQVEEGSSVRSLRDQNSAKDSSCSSLTRSLKAKTLSTDSDVILCEDTEEGIFTRDQLTSLIKDSLSRLTSDLLPNETPEAGRAKGSNEVARKSQVDDGESVILLD